MVRSGLCGACGSGGARGATCPISNEDEGVHKSRVPSVANARKKGLHIQCAQ